MSISALAKRAGLHPSTLSRMLRGEVVPAWLTVRRLAHVLGDEPPLLWIERAAPSHPQLVREALAADPELEPEDRRYVMRYYLAIRRSANDAGP
jgi:transcriptional regulator with XRE-family HTH domain